ncbi:DUF4870 domain-containing protein [Aquibacillus albus]|uniref:Tic20 family protein n=1 Tax=Aquibacillus albus TaxID=1168171 RepID=A0ABS2MZ64_9BACI|nr:DUF4870 domain-containing protein [Aquibacillus albus]MBM7571098.1 putative Tic20 family protein [Aquibacillus albus]
MVSTKEKLMAVFGYLIPIFFPIPLLSIVAIQVYYLLFRGESIFFDEHARENVNFQISYQIYLFSLFGIGYIFSKLAPILPEASIPFNVIVLFGAFGLIIFAGLFWFITMIIAIIRAVLGKRFRFPLTIRFIK